MNNSKWAADLQFILFWQHKEVWKYLLERVRSVANTSTRSTQNIWIEKMIKDYNFKVIVPPDKEKTFIYKLLMSYKKNISTYLDLSDLLTINDI